MKFSDNAGEALFRHVQPKSKWSLRSRFDGNNLYLYLIFRGKEYTIFIFPIKQD